MDGGLNLFFPLKSDLRPADGKLTDEEIRCMLAKPHDSPRVVEHKLRTYKALAGFEERQNSQQGCPVIVESTADSVADRVAEIAGGPSTRQTVDVLAEHLWWLTQGAEGWPFPEGRAARSGYWNAARKVLAQVGTTAWLEACKACLLILRDPTADEQKWMGRCSSPHGWIGGVVKRVIGGRVVEARESEWYTDVSATIDAETLWAQIVEYLTGTLTRLNVLELKDGSANWRGRCLVVSFPLGRRSVVESGGLEMSVERAASKICDTPVEVCFEQEGEARAKIMPCT